MQALNIYQVFHKPYPHNANCSWITPITVSGYRQGGAVNDSDGENISELNPYYCELTALYWMWKHNKSSYIGLYHYRRYMSYIADETFTSPDKYVQVDPTDQNLTYLTQESQLHALHKKLAVFDVVLPRKLTQIPSVGGLYMQLHAQEPWQAFIGALNQKYPHHAKEIEYFSQSTDTTVCNMFVMKSVVYEAYCKDLFEIVDLVYHKVGAPYDSWNNRYPGFLAERFLGFWLFLRGLSWTTVPLVFMR